MAKHISELSFRKKVEFYLTIWFGWILVYLLHKTYKIKVEGEEILTELKKQKQPFLVTIWHGRFFLGVYYFRLWHLVALVSQHLDGEMISRILLRFRFKTVRGSSTRGGKEAFHKMVTTLKCGKSCVIIPDGPTGPRHQLKPGTIYMSYQAQVPIVCFTFSAKSAIIFNSWDRFVLPKPFSRVLVKIGKPIWPLQDASNRDLVKMKKYVETEMINQEKEADVFFSP